MAEVTAPANTGSKRPYFIWSADLTEEDVRTILARERGDLERLHLIAHIIQNARFEDIWKYIRVTDIVENWEQIRRALWPAEMRELWGWALNVWGYHVPYP